MIPDSMIPDRRNRLFTSRQSVLTAGFFALDVVLFEEQLAHRAGGTAANVAANLAFLGWRSRVMGLIGKDPAGAHLLRDLTKAGVDTSGTVRRGDVMTPVVIHEIFDGNHRFRFGCPECGRQFPRARPLPLDHVSKLLEETPKVFFFDRISSAALEAARVVRVAKGTVVFEPALASGSDSFQLAVSLAHIIKFSSDKRRVLEPFLNSVSADTLQVISAGVEGAYWRRGRRPWRHEQAYDIDVVDPGGAGDWMTAGLLASIGGISPSELSDAQISDALSLAQALAALSCQYPGARGISTGLARAEIERLLRNLETQKHDASRSRSLGRPSRRQASCPSCLAPL